MARLILVYLLIGNMVVSCMLLRMEPGVSTWGQAVTWSLLQQMAAAVWPPVAIMVLFTGPPGSDPSTCAI